MPRRPKASRAVGAASAPTPVTSSHATPLSSAYPSTYASEAEGDGDVNSIPISSLTLDASNLNTTMIKKKLTKPFAFLSLPSELRLKVYDFYFDGSSDVVDLDADNYKKLHKPLGILRTCKTIYTEASYFFYSSRPFRVFPTVPGRSFKTKKPLLARLTPLQRASLTSLELRLGPGWNKPPRGWVVNTALGLRDCINVRKLTVFVECDPSDGIFNGFRRADGFYEGFCRTLLHEVLAELPLLDFVDFDAWSSVKKSGAMMRTLLEVVSLNNRKVRWGPERGWTDAMDEDDLSRLPTKITPPGFGGQGILVLA